MWWVKYTSSSMLLTINPLPFIILLRSKSKCSLAVLTSMLVISMIAWRVSPIKCSLPMHLSFIPASLIIRSIWKRSFTLSLRSKWFRIYKAFINPAISILYSSFSIGKIIQKYAIRFSSLIKIVNNQFAIRRKWIFKSSLKAKIIV